MPILTNHLCYKKKKKSNPYALLISIRVKHLQTTRCFYQSEFSNKSDCVQYTQCAIKGKLLMRLQNLAVCVESS